MIADYDAPLTEAGDYTEKYYLTKRLVKHHNNLKIHLPKEPPESLKIAYSSVYVTQHLTFEDLLKRIVSFVLPITFNSIQILFRMIH